jgi:hypothetical protein
MAGDLVGQKRSAWRQYLQQYGTVAEQLDEIDRELVWLMRKT